MKIKLSSSLALTLSMTVVLALFGAAARVSAVDPVSLKVVKVDSEETAGEDGKGANAVDGDPNTKWHTQWQDNSPGYPHEIIIELSRACKIQGFTYLPRQDDTENGNIKDYEFYVSEDGKEFGSPVKKGAFERSKGKKTVVFQPKACKFVKLKALSEINDQAWAAAAEIGVIQEGEKVVIKPTLKVVKVDSEETAGEDGKGANAVDGDPNTKWHTQWQDNSPSHPHEIIIELDPPAKIQGFTYLPRQDDGENGSIKDYEFYVSDDGKEFGQPVAKGAFAGGKDKKTVLFELKQCRFVKLKALSELADQAWTSAAEIGVVAEGEKVSIKPVLKVVKADSEETAGEDGKAANAVDGDPNTKWHTQWQDNSPGYPHEIIIELNPPGKITGFTYLPRQDEGENGTIKDYEFYVSEDGKEFGQPVKKGTFESGKTKKTVIFDATACKFIKLKALSEVNNQAWASAAEIDVIPE
ncbi:MAG: discoidin domain-containing protein [Verrucomicrobiota bacterium]